MKKITALLLLVAITFCGFAQNVLVTNRNLYHPDGEEDVLLSPTGKLIKSLSNVEVKGEAEGLICAVDKERKKLGFLSKETGEWVINPQFDNARCNGFYEGLAVIQADNDGKPANCVIDKTGKIIVPVTEWTISDFSDGMTIVSTFNSEKVQNYGVIDKSGNVVIPFALAFIGDFSEGLAVKEDASGKLGYINKSGKWVIKAQWAVAGVFKDGMASVSEKSEDDPLFSYVDKTGKRIGEYEFITANPFSEGIAAVGIMVGKGDDAVQKMTYIDKTGERITKDIFEYAMSFSEGLGGVSKEVGEQLLYGFMDKTGKMVIPMTHEQSEGMNPIMAFKEGFCPTKKGYIDAKGKLAIPLKGILSTCQSFENGVTSLCIFNEKGDNFKYTLVNKTGKILWQSVDNQSLCFPAGVYVSLANGGRKKIEDIKVGDTVLDLDNTPSVVDGLEVHHGDFIIGAVHFNMPENVSFVSNDGLKNKVLLEATLNHPLSILGKKIALNDVKTGDLVLQIIDNQIVSTSVAFLDKKYKTVSKVYNLKTKGKGYFVNGYGVFNK
jgi:WG containing repeat